MVEKKIAIFLDNDHYFSLIFLKKFFKSKNKKNYLIFLGKEFINFKRILISFKILGFNQFLSISLDVFLNKVFNKVKKYLNRKQLIFYNNLNINSHDVLSILRENKVKSCISVINSQIFKKEKYKKFEIYNLHLGKLPEFKGIVPVVNAYIKGKKIFYSTIFKISFKGIDNGEIIFVSKIKLKECLNLFDVYKKLYLKGFKDIETLSNQIELNKKIKKRKVKQKNSNYYNYPSLYEIFKLKGP